ncbi:segregation/condensation protein A [Streptomyces sp. NPDC049040]|uniref:segregation/condensation protein A n=1 Tax=Streptomyces sp. NPDC049040 TaxID=3365593 RepID=UPI00371C22E1
MPTTSTDDPDRPRRRLGRGASALPGPRSGDPAPEAAQAAIPEPAAEAAPAEVPQAVGADAGAGGAVDVPAVVPQGGPADPPRDVPAAGPEDAAGDVREGVPAAGPEGAAGDVREGVLAGGPEDAAADVREEVPAAGPEDAAGDVREGVPAGGPEGVSPGVPEHGAVGAAGGAAPVEEAADGRFTVRLANFEGPFDLLLQLISKHKLDVTEVALSKVTNEFMAHLQAMGPDWDLDQTTEFLVVAATLLDLKAARLLPAAEVEDEADLALLEARDLLFARLLQYRAYKQIAGIFADRLAREALHHPRTVGLEPQHAELLPEVVLSIGPERFAQLAVKAMQPRPRPQVYVDHIHAPLVSVREQAEQVIALLRERGTASFGDLTADAPDTLTVVARFLALLELYREKAVALDQEEALGELLVRWTGGEEPPDAPLVTDEFDQEAAAKPAKGRNGEQR